MEGERTTREAIEAFMQSELAETAVRRESETIFVQQVDTFIRTLNLEQWASEPQMLGSDVSYFLEDEINAGRLHEIGDLGGYSAGELTPSEHNRYEEVWGAIYNIALDHLTSRQVEVYRDQPMREAIEGFIASEVGREIVRPGAETEFQAAMTAWMHRLDVDRIEGPLFEEYVDEVLGNFIDTEVSAGHLEPPEDLYAVGPIEGVWDALQHVTEVGVEARYSLEVARGDREDMRSPMEATEEMPAVAAPQSIAERLQGLMQTVKEFVRGHEAEMPARDRDLER